MLRDFYAEMKANGFKPMKYSLYNKLDDSGYIIQLKNEYNEVFSIDDFECYQFKLTDEEKMFLRLNGKNMVRSVNELVDKLKWCDKVKIDIDKENGTICVAKIKDVEI